MSTAIRNDVALRTFLAPITERLIEPGVNEVIINRPGEVFVEQGGLMRRIVDERLTLTALTTLATTIASYNGQKVDQHTPLLSGALPEGERVQIVLPPAVEQGQVAFSIRKPTALKLTLGDYAAAGAFDNCVFDASALSAEEKELLALKRVGDIQTFLEKAVQYRQNIVVCGGTSTGKTTFMNALMRVIPYSDRLITIEDTREIQLDHINKLHLLYSKGGQGVAKVTAQSLLQACLRLRPDRILLSELRGDEAFDWLQAVNSGHPGSITSLHADSPASAFSRLIMMVMRAGLDLAQDQILAYLHSVIDVVVQLQRVDGQRVITEVLYEPQR